MCLKAIILDLRLLLDYYLDFIPLNKDFSKPYVLMHNILKDTLLLECEVDASLFLMVIYFYSASRPKGFLRLFTSGAVNKRENILNTICRRENVNVIF